MMKTPDGPAGAVLPHYVTTGAGQLRVWRAGSGPNLVVLPGLVMSAAVTAHAMAQAHPGWTLTVVELPGIGGSAQISPENPAQIAAEIHEGLAELGIHDAALLAHDLSAPIANALASRWPAPARLILLDGEAARQWVAGGVAPPVLELRDDGTHLSALWTHFRDRSMLDAADPARVGRRGAPLPTTQDLDTAVVAAAVRPTAYAALWSCCAAGLDTGLGAADIASPAELHARLALWAAQMNPASMVPARSQGTSLRRDYLQTPSGRVHMRRVGGGGRTLLMFHSAPGSAEPLEGLIQGLARGREVIVCDYLGNGDSDKARGDIDIDMGVLAQHAHEIVDALGLEVVDLFGTHTGAMVALEFAIAWPERTGRIVLEAPVLLDPAFLADILAHYLPPLLPDRWGTHLLRAWNMRRDMFLFWPWYRQTREAARSLGTPPLQTLHDWTVGLLKSGSTYHLSYRAAFTYDTRARLPLLTRPALICAGPADMLVEGLELARGLAPVGTVIEATPATVWYPGQSAEAVAASIAIYDDFLRRR